MGEWHTFVVSSTVREALKPPHCGNLFAPPSSASPSVFTGDEDDSEGMLSCLMLAYELCYRRITVGSLPWGKRRSSGPLLKEPLESEEKDSSLPEIGSVTAHPELCQHIWAWKRLGGRSRKASWRRHRLACWEGAGHPGAE